MARDSRSLSSLGTVLIGTTWISMDLDDYRWIGESGDGRMARWTDGWWKRGWEGVLLGWLAGESSGPGWRACEIMPG